MAQETLSSAVCSDDRFFRFSFGTKTRSFEAGIAWGRDDLPFLRSRVWYRPAGSDLDQTRILDFGAGVTCPRPVGEREWAFVSNETERGVLCIFDGESGQVRRYHHPESHDLFFLEWGAPGDFLVAQADDMVTLKTWYRGFYFRNVFDVKQGRFVSSRVDDEESLPPRTFVAASGQRPAYLSLGDERSERIVFYVHGGPVKHVKTANDPYLGPVLQKGFRVIVPLYSGTLGQGASSVRCLWGQFGQQDAREILEVVTSVVNGLNSAPKEVVFFGGSSAGFTILKMLELAELDLRIRAVLLYPLLVPKKTSRTTHEIEKPYFTFLFGFNRSLWPSLRSSILPERLASLTIFHGMEDEVIAWQDSFDFSEEVSQMMKTDLRIMACERHGFVLRSTIDEVVNALVETVS